MKRGPIVGIVAMTALVIVTGLWSWRHLRSAALTPAEFMLKVHSPEPPQRLTEGCSEVRQAQALSIPSTASRHEKPVKSATPFTADEVAIYRAVLEHWLAHEPTSLNVSAATFPLDATSPLSGLSDCGCLQGINLGNISSPFHSFRDLTSGVLPGKNMRLVDAKRQAGIVHANDPHKTIGTGKTVKDAVRDAFATGLFSMSEIAFDTQHHFALVSYAFWCGSLCGNGATLVFEKIGGEWKRTDRRCGGWIS